MKSKWLCLIVQAQVVPLIAILPTDSYWFAISWSCFWGAMAVIFAIWDIFRTHPVKGQEEG